MHPASQIAPLFALVAPLALANAQSIAPFPDAASIPERVYTDRPGDGRAWARGVDWKASFDAGGVTYYPYVGPDAPGVSLALSIESVTRGSDDVPFAAVDPALEQYAVRYERGSVTERFELRPHEIEQLFVFDELPGGAGDLVVRVAVESELAFAEDPGGFAFGNEWGGARYGRAVALDAAGERVEAPTAFVDGAIEIRVREEFLLRATLPLVIDPLVTAFLIGQSATTSSPDVAYDEISHRYLVCWQNAFSATDHDIYARFYTADGVPVPNSGEFIDFTSDDWRQPSVANNNAADTFLVVATRGPDGGREIVGRVRSALSNTMGGQFVISGTEFGEKLNPSVGGDAAASGATTYCVVWERAKLSIDHDIDARLVSSAGIPLGPGTILLEASGFSLDRNPSISKTNGRPVTPVRTWNVVWERFEIVPQQGDIYGAQIGSGGTVVNPTFLIDSSLEDDRFPTASPLLDTPIGGRQWMVAYQRESGPTNDVIGQLFVGNSPRAMANLSELMGDIRHEERPRLDSDGCQFALGYISRHTNPLFGSSARLASFYASGESLHHSESILLSQQAGRASELRICAARASTAFANNPEVVAAWHQEDLVFQNPELVAATSHLLGGYGQCIDEPFCGPNNANSTGQPARIHATGSAHAGGDPLNLRAYSMPQNEFGYFLASQNVGMFQPPNAAGFLCISGPIARFTGPGQIGFSGPSGTFELDVDTTSIPMNPPVAVMAGDVWLFQAWYRDGTTSNFTDATRVVFQ